VQALFHKQPNVIKKIESLPRETHFFASTITLGEIEAGHQMTQTTNQKRRDEYTTWVIEKFVPHAYPVKESTRHYYAQIIGRIWRKHPPAKSSISTEAHLVSLGVDINDVWTVAVAWEHGLVFVTQDAMQCIREAVGNELRMECWT